MSNRIFTISLIMVIALGGCSTTPEKNSQSSNKPVDRTKPIENRPVEQENDLTALNQQLISLQKAQRYLETDSGQIHYQNGICKAATIPDREVVPYPEDACRDEIDQIPIIQKYCEVNQKCDLVSALVIQNKLPPEWEFISALGCSFSAEEQTLLTQSTTTMSTAFCAVGAGKSKNKYFNIFRLGRSAACAYSLQNIVKRSDKLASCISREQGRCKDIYNSWKQSEERSIENHKLIIIVAENDLSTCQASTEILANIELPKRYHLRETIESLKEKIQEVERKAY